MESKKNKPDTKKNPKFDLFMVGVSWPREELYSRIEQRVDNQLKRGLVDEVKALHAKKYKSNLPAISSLGVKEIMPFINGEKSLEDCIKELKLNTRHYGKRQMTWFKRYANVNWISPEEYEKL